MASFFSAHQLTRRGPISCARSSGVWSGKVVVLRLDPVGSSGRQRCRVYVAAPERGAQGILGRYADLVLLGNPDALEVLSLEPQRASGHANAICLDERLGDP